MGEKTERNPQKPPKHSTWELSEARKIIKQGLKKAAEAWVLMKNTWVMKGEAAALISLQSVLGWGYGLLDESVSWWLLFIVHFAPCLWDLERIICQIYGKEVSRVSMEQSSRRCLNFLLMFRYIADVFWSACFLQICMMLFGFVSALLPRSLCWDSGA